MASTTIPSPEPPASASPGGPEVSDSDDATPRDLEEVLVVQLGGATYAVPTALVREVAPATPVTPLPGAPAWVLGVTAVRGALLPVADLARRAGAGAHAAAAAAGDRAGARDGWTVVVDDGRRSAAFVGLRVRGVVPARDAAAAPHADGAQRDDAPSASADRHGLPVRGAVRLVDDGRRSAGAGPVRLARRTRARGAVTRPPADDGAPTLTALARLDVTALLDDLFDQGG